MPLDTDGQWTGATPFPVPDPTINDGANDSLVDTRGLFVLHALLLHTGQVLCFCGHVETLMYAPLCYLFDPEHPARPLTPIAFPPGADLFCCHYVQTFDGRVLVAGGSELHGLNHLDFLSHGSTGSKTIALFDPDTKSWAVSKTGGSDNVLTQGRWYPTLVTLPDGRIAVFSGRREFGSGVPYPSIASMVEILSAPDWGSQELADADKPLPIYPGLHLAPNGRIYFTHTTWGQEMASPDTASLLIANGATSATWTNYAGLQPPHPRREEGMSVLLPPAQDGKILVIGGSRALNIHAHGLLDPAGHDPADPTDGFGPNAFHHIEDVNDPRAADLLDTTTEPPTWSSVGPMHFGRTNGHCVILPDGTVFICGGHNNYKWLAKPTTEPALPAEIYTPGGAFKTVAATLTPRMYHSVALLLPDGRVFVAGGADANRNEPPLVYPVGWVGRTYDPGMALNDKSFEFYRPPYLYKGPQPTITGVRRNNSPTARLEYNQAFTIQTAQAADIDKVALLRLGSCTHHTDTEQRYVRLTFTKGAGALTATTVADAKVAPPGYYMLWIVDTTGRPCEKAWIVQLVGPGTTCFVATAAFGSPDHPGVAYLQNLRQELRTGSRAGRWFLGSVTWVYERFSPRAARALTANAPWRTAVRELVVRPTIGVIRQAERLAPRRGRHAVLLVLLAGAALLGLAVLPALALAVVVRVALAPKE